MPLHSRLRRKCTGSVEACELEQGFNSFVVRPGSDLR